MAEGREAADMADGPKPALLDIDMLFEAGRWPPAADLEALAAAAIVAVEDELALAGQPSELSLVFTDDAHMQALNSGWRGADKPTNVLSFPAALPPGHDAGLPPILGDIILAEETISREAALEDKPFEHHLTHLIVHGLLHLLGYDHESESEADVMEAAEQRVLARLAIPDPYA